MHTRNPPKLDLELIQHLNHQISKMLFNKLFHDNIQDQKSNRIKYLKALQQFNRDEEPRAIELSYQKYLDSFLYIFFC